MQINAHITLPEEDLSESFMRASGPGGQNVNKVASAVQLRFDVEHCQALTTEVKQRLKRLAGQRLNKHGVIVITATTFRRQEQNRQEARRRLKQLILQALPAPKLRKKPKKNIAAIRKRLNLKKQRGQLKQMRQKPTGD
ncbi:MAG: alternative ribosome rescue aminoacyl-tRNA hydrolase ArfB [bacterium]